MSPLAKMKRGMLHAIALVAISSASTFAFAQEILVWKATPTAPRVVLPKLSNETAAQAVEKYFASMQANAEMAEFFSNYRRVDLSKSTFAPLPPLAISAGTRVLIQANEPNDIDPGGWRINELLDVVRDQKAEPFVLPPAAVMRLSPKQQSTFQDALYDRFDMRMNIGGDDVHPAHYGEKVSHARKDELNRTRDKFEIQLIRHWQSRNASALSKGIPGKIEFGICRGHQIMAVAEGHTMFQDNVRDGVSRDGTHLDRLGDPSSRSKQHWHHVFVKDSLFAQILGRVGRVLVNDWHHQSVRVNPNLRTQPVALAPDGVVEAMESKDGLTLSVQFHPEFKVGQSGNAEFTAMGHRLIGGIFSHARESRLVRECSSVFRVAK